VKGFDQILFSLDPAYDEKIILKFDESESFENKANSHKWWDQFDPIWTIAEKQACVCFGIKVLLSA
jgi:hypothetical protein